MKGKVLIVSGILSLLVAFTLVGNNARKSTLAGIQSKQVLSKMTINSYDNLNNYTQDYMIDSEIDMAKIEIDNNKYIGKLEIPKFNIELPISSELNYDNLKIAPGRYSGSVYNDNLIIAGHNYSSHFGKLSRLENGDSICITDVDGNKFRYEVSYAEILDGYDVDKMETGDWDLTLFTCTYDGQSRITVRCLGVN